MPHCQPTYWYESGREDPFAFCAKGNKLYVVTNGTVCGIFSSEWVPLGALPLGFFQTVSVGHEHANRSRVCQMGAGGL